METGRQVKEIYQEIVAMVGIRWCLRWSGSSHSVLVVLRVLAAIVLPLSLLFVFFFIFCVFLFY